MECTRIPEINYSAFGEQMFRASQGRRIPWTGAIELTARCNLKCVHCYINLAEKDEGAQGNELTSSEVCGLLDEITDKGCLNLLLTGGEIFLRNDFLDIYTHAKRKGLIVTLFTNGTLITSRIADYLRDWPPHAVEITLYGSTEATYSRVTGVTGAFSRCIRGLDLLMDRGIRVRLKTMVLTLNKHELGEMESFASQRGLDFHFDPVLNMRLDSNRAPRRYRLSPEQVVALDMCNEKRTRAWKDFISRHSGPPREPEKLYRCGAGLGNFHIDSFGRLSPCIISRKPSYELRTGGFAQGWHQFLPEVISRTRSRVAPCQTCRIASLCDQCPGMAQLEYGDQEKRVDYFCKVAHLRAQALGLEEKGPGDA